MATEPTSLKTALAVAVVSFVGPAAGELAFVLVGGFFGALLALQRRAPMEQWWQPYVHVGQGVVAAVLFAGAASSVLAHTLPASWQVSVDLLWVPVAALIAMNWRDGLAAVVKRFKGKLEP